MTYIIIGLTCFIIVAILHTVCTKDIDVTMIGICSLAVIISFGLTTLFDYKNQTDDVEIWSGKVIDVEHKEEWNEYHPPKVETYTTTDSNGKTVTKTRTKAGYWEHHYAENHIETTDKGRFSVKRVPDGRKLTDDFVNSDKELEQYFPIGKPTSSAHTFENKLKASYSVFKHKEISLKDYEGLPEYPEDTNDNLTVNRLFGNFKNKDKVSQRLDEINTRLNDTDNPKNIDKVKSYKQVNLMLVNFGDKSEDYGYALQDYWKNGAKNDFVVTFGTDSKGKIIWTHAFSWTDAEILKTDVREYIIGTNVKDMIKSVDDVADMIEEKFNRKEFKEFDYIQVEVSTTAKVVMFAMFVIICLVYCFADWR